MTLVIFTSSTVVYTIVYIRNTSSDNLTNILTIYEMYDCYCMILKKINMKFVSLSSSIHPPVGKETSTTVYCTNSKILFVREISTY